MKKIFFLLILFSSSQLYGQISDFKNYQEKINSAEINLVRGQKQEALNIYFNILTTSKGNFCKDIYNSMILSNELKKEDTFFVFLNMLIGLPLIFPYYVIILCSEHLSLNYESKEMQYNSTSSKFW